MEWGLPSGLTAWQLMNSEAMGTLIGAIATLVGAVIGTRIIQRVVDQTEQQKKTAAEVQRAKRGAEGEVSLSDHELELVEAQAERGQGRFAEASQEFKKISASVNSLVGGISDGRRRRKYKGLRKTDLRDYVYLLWQDDMLGLPTAQLVDDAITDFYSYRTRPADIPAAVVKKISDAARSLISMT